MTLSLAPFIFALLLPPVSGAGPQTIEDLLERYSTDESSQQELKELSKRIQFKQPKVESRDMPSGLNRFCGGKLGQGRRISFAAKDYSVKWGIGKTVAAGEVSYKPKGATSYTTKNHIYYEVCSMDHVLIEKIGALACELEADEVVVTSAFRDPIQNLLEGGKSGSQHLLCKAMDFKLTRIQTRSTVDPSLIQRRAYFYPEFRGLGKGRTYTHLDTRPFPKSYPRDVWVYK